MNPIAVFKGREEKKSGREGGEMRERDGSRRGGKAEGRDEERPPTLKCRKIHSFSFFSSHKIVTRGPLKSRKCTRKRLAKPAGGA